MNDSQKKHLQISLPQDLETWRWNASRNGLNPAPIQLQSSMLMPALLQMGSGDLYHLVMPKGAKGDLVTLQNGLKSTLLTDGGKFTGSAGLVKANGGSIQFWPSLVAGMFQSCEIRLKAISDLLYTQKQARMDDKYAELRSCKQIIESVAREYGLDDPEMRESNRSRLADANDKCYELLCSLMPELVRRDSELHVQNHYDLNDRGMTSMLSHPVIEAFEVFAIGSICRFAQSKDRSVNAIEVFEERVRKMAQEIRTCFRFTFQYLNTMVGKYEGLYERARTDRLWDDEYISTDRAETSLKNAWEIRAQAHQRLAEAIDSRLQVFEMLKEMAKRSGPVEVAISKDVIVISDAKAEPTVIEATPTTEALPNASSSAPANGATREISLDELQAEIIRLKQQGLR